MSDKDDELKKALEEIFMNIDLSEMLREYAEQLEYEEKYAGAFMKIEWPIDSYFKIDSGARG